jgi:hypothetical protein
VQEDNVLVEFNIPPAATKQDFIYSIQTGKRQIDMLFPPGVEVRVQSSAFLPVPELANPMAQEFGCDPDFCAWTDGKMNIKPPLPTDGLRSAGGHLHTGYELTPFAKSIGVTRQDIGMELIKAYDYYLGVPSIIMDRDLFRRRLYGKAGAFRAKPYGVEYRTLSSFWLKDLDLIDWAYTQTMRAITEVSAGNYITNALGEKIQKAINTSDQTLASELALEGHLEVL